MVDFNKHLAAGKPEKKLHPIEIYDSLDRRSDKGPLRPAQIAVLSTWYETRLAERDIILKLHTGEGKTLTGLLMLQSKLNQSQGPALYLCPNKYLAEQTQIQADKFGIKQCTIGKDRQIPADFTNGKSILITHVQKLFNGKSKFGLGNRAQPVEAIVLDDSHACIDTLRQAFTIRLTREKHGPLFDQLLAFFEDDLRNQSLARTDEVKAEEWNVLLPVPYWTWQNRLEEVSRLLTEHREEDGLLFVWDLVKDSLRDCQCFITGQTIEISPYHNPIELLGSFDKAKLRVFMSATTNDDSFFVKELGLSSTTVSNPLTYEDVKWSGEKMILMPYNMDYHLSHSFIVSNYGKEAKGRSYGIVVIAPSFNDGAVWKSAGAEVMDGDTLASRLQSLKAGDGAKALVMANRYDGIDLPDDACRILILDGKPSAETLSDRYQEECREGSEVLAMKTAQKIEQGLGRGVRGEKDYCVILLIDHELTSFISTLRNQRFFSPQTRKQLEIGVDVSGMVAQEATTSDSAKELSGIINQCLRRDEGWKNYYIQEMNSVDALVPDRRLLPILELERKAELSYRQNEVDRAVKHLQTIVDQHLSVEDDAERGWYLQEMARIRYATDKNASGQLQIVAHKKNQYVLKPQHGMQVSKLIISQTQAEGARAWLHQTVTYKEAFLQLSAILNHLHFGVDAKKFEKALQDLGTALGFRSGRPDKEYGAGPDNLWNIASGDYLLFECKNEVKTDRPSIYKTETGQMANSLLWFEREYADAQVTPIMIIPTRKIGREAGLRSDVVVMLKPGLRRLRDNALSYIKAFQKQDLLEITPQQVFEALETNNLTRTSLKTAYTEVTQQLV
jgi:hypothetical protein